MYTFGPFRFDPASRLLWRGHDIVPLTPKAGELLGQLVEHAGQVLSKDDLIRRVWPDTFVEEANLSHHVYRIREALGEHPGGGDYIETLARRGYRFVAPVARDAAPPSTIAAAHDTPTPAPADLAATAAGQPVRVPHPPNLDRDASEQLPSHVLFELQNQVTLAPVEAGPSQDAVNQ